MKLKKQKFYIWGLIICMIAVYGFFPIAPNASAVDAITVASDTISDSDAGETAVTHTFDFTTGTSTEASGAIEITFPAEFGDILVGNISCPAAWTETAPDTETVRCSPTAATQAAGVQQISVDVDNPIEGDEGTYTINIRNYDYGTHLAERVEVMVSIHQDVLMTATVTSILNFSIEGVDAGSKSVNGVPCDNTSTATATPFGTLLVNTASSVCQKLNVETNADDGYVVTVQQDNEMTSDAGSTINSFDNSPDTTGSTTAHAWNSPDNTLDLQHTYGHMGLTSDDSDLSAVFANQNYYNGGGAAWFAGFNNSQPIAVMHHDGPSDNVTQDMGEAYVLYRTEIASLQEAGDYESTLTYICTPTF